ncbi:MAG: hypothetical protein JKY66_07610 [Spongiibacteraceae bacterium]|nr:hypothetical protein [Spongiibacteraceae bacterium]
MIEYALAPLHWMDFVGPIIPAGIFIVIMSFIAEPTRQRFNAIFVAGAGAVYLSNGGLGAGEFIFTAVITLLAYKGLNNYRYIGIAWLLHTGWDLLHHFYGNPIFPLSVNSSMGCAICDLVLGIWFLLGAPSVIAWWYQKPANTSK